MSGLTDLAKAVSFAIAFAIVQVALSFESAVAFGFIMVLLQFGGRETQA